MLTKKMLGIGARVGSLTCCASYGYIKRSFGGFKSSALTISARPCGHDSSVFLFEMLHSAEYCNYAILFFFHQKTVGRSALHSDAGAG